ncbi:MAG: hypothetical protein EYC62_08600 [Alphaproteobacteria bacterium]|nr:MAG: hypothetical protein EYC62_08600 [Alphaproteobacteria bacterium]
MFEFFTRFFKPRRPKPVTVQLETFVDHRPGLSHGELATIAAQLEPLRLQHKIPDICGMAPGYRNQRPSVVLSIPRNLARPDDIRAFRLAAQDAIKHTGLAVFVEYDTVGTTEAINRKAVITSVTLPQVVTALVASGNTGKVRVA